MLGIARGHIVCLVFALVGKTVVAGENPPPRRVVVPMECTDPEGAQEGCRGWYDVETDERSQLAGLTAAREKACTDTFDARACNWAGRRFEKGEGVSRDAREAARLYAAACQGSASDSASNDGCGALARLAARLEKGQGFTREADLAAALYVRSCRAARSPDQMWMSAAPACLALAGVYLRGEIVPQDLGRAGALYAAACGGPSYAHEGCAGLVLVDIEGGLASTPAPETPARYWLDPVSLANLCREGAGDPVACRALAFRYHRGSRMPADERRARVLFARACALGDAPSCQVLRASGADLPEDPVATCASGDAEGCWHRDLRLCRGDLPLAATDTAGAGSTWSPCVDARRGCGDGSATSCTKLAFALAYDQHGLPLARARGGEALERGLLLHEAACARGDALACHAAADLQGKSWGFASIPVTTQAAMRERALTLEEGACETGEVEVCLRLAERYTRPPDDTAADPRRARRFYTRAAEIDGPACEAGDLEVCERLSRTYDWGLHDRSRAISIWRRPCRDGAKKACEHLAGFKDDGAFGATATFGARWGQPIGWSGSLTLVLGERYVSRGGSCAGIIFPGYGGRGWLVQLEPGVEGGKIGVGWGETSTILAPPLTTGRAIKLSYLHGWSEHGRLTSGNDYAGIETDWSLIGLKGSVGVYKGVGRDSGTLLTWGVGVGF